jgi:hypothetical protein
MDCGPGSSKPYSTVRGPYSKSCPQSAPLGAVGSCSAWERLCLWRSPTSKEPGAAFCFAHNRHCFAFHSVQRTAHSAQRQRPQNLTSASGDGDAIWGAHRPNYIHGQFGGFFFGPPGTPGPPVHPRGSSHRTDFPPLSCSVLRGPARPPSATSKRRPGGPYSRWTPCAGGQAKQK